MKYIILISFFFVAFLLINSCDDSLGIEKNVLITKNDTSGLDTTGKDTVEKIEASIDSTQFFEDFLLDGIPFRYPIDELITFHEAYVDTSTYPVFIWVKLSIKNINGDDIYNALGRNEYTQSIRFIADSLQGTGPFRLNGAPNSSYWSELGVRNITLNDSTFLSGSESSFEIEFRFDFKKHITAFIYAEIPNSKEPGNKIFVAGSFIIKYPK